jgi:hypothetical protein
MEDEIIGIHNQRASVRAEEALWEKLTLAYFVVLATIQQRFDEALACSAKLKASGTFNMNKGTWWRCVRMAHGGTARRIEPESARATARPLWKDI